MYRSMGLLLQQALIRCNMRRKSHGSRDISRRPTTESIMWRWKPKQIVSTVFSKVLAATLEKSLQYVQEDPDDMPLPTDSYYIDGSFK